MFRSDEKKSEASVQIYEITDDIYSLDDVPGLDRVYHAKARLLNNAIQEVGMGKYQVRPQPSPPANPTNPSSTVVALRCRRFRMAGGQSMACECMLSQPRVRLTGCRSSPA